MGKKRKRLEEQYHHVVNTAKPVSFELRIDRLNACLQVKAFPTEEGLSIFMTDITEAVRGRQELEKLSLVASNITNDLIITDANHQIEWVNNGFSQAKRGLATLLSGHGSRLFLLNILKNKTNGCCNIL